jgi:hypothetical protein
MRVNLPDLLKEDYGDAVVIHHPKISNAPTEDEFTLTDLPESTRVKQGVYSIVIDAAIMRGGGGSGMVMKLKEYFAVKSTSFEYVLENIGNGVDSFCRRSKDFDDKTWLLLRWLKVMDGHSVLFEMPFERSTDAIQDGLRRGSVLQVDKAKVVDADLSQVEAFCKLVPGANGRDLRGQILESMLGL